VRYLAQIKGTFSKFVSLKLSKSKDGCFLHATIKIANSPQLTFITKSESYDGETLWDVAKLVEVDLVVYQDMTGEFQLDKIEYAFAKNF
jgi:hypothetical protein